MMNDLKYMVLSALAYEDFTYADKEAALWGYTVVSFLTDGPAQAYLFAGTHDNVLAYRGTEASDGDLWDILSNVRVHARTWEGPGKAHLGYVRQYRRIRDDLHQIIGKLPSEKPLVVTGHSMGGAIATIAAAHDMYVKDWDFHRLVTFGSPACMNKEGHAAITCEHTRYVNKWDPAPIWPPSFTIDHGVKATKIDSKTSVFNRHAPDVYLKAMGRGQDAS